ncbi:MAG: phosphatase PAP2 family protein [Flavobacteriaceae bacterium]|nr:phosphatase PAP2 family protein [Flavobacteriaceae bacterium]
MLDNLIQLDKNLLVFLNNLGSEQWDSIWLVITNQFYWTPLFIFIFYLIIKSYGWKHGAFMILSIILLVAFSDQFVNLIKDSVGRLRPNNDPEIMNKLRTLINPQSKSFISGHATTSTFFTVYVILLLKKSFGKPILWLLIYPLLFSYSRLYLGVHFPLDILVGVLTGFLLAFIYFSIYKKIDKKSFI